MAVAFSSADLTWTCRDKRRIRAWFEQVISSCGCELGEIEVIFCSDAFLLEVNQTALQHDYFTDIITFDYCSGDVISGDLFISIDRVRENAREYGVSFSTELRRVLIHGVLHLCGWTDGSAADKAAMRSEETRLLALFPA